MKEEKDCCIITCPIYCQECTPPNESAKDKLRRILLALDEMTNTPEEEIPYYRVGDVVFIYKRSSAAENFCVGVIKEIRKWDGAPGWDTFMYRAETSWTKSCSNGKTYNCGYGFIGERLLQPIGQYRKCLKERL